MGFPDGTVDKESAYNAGDLHSVPGLGRSPGEGSLVAACGLLIAVASLVAAHGLQ